MSITTLVTHVEPGDVAALDRALAAPLALAEAHGARLTALVFPAEALRPEASTPAAVMAAEEERTLAHVRALAERRGVPCELRARSSFAYGIGEVVVDHLRVSDMGLFGLPRAPGAGRRLMCGAAVFDSGRPVLLVPEEAGCALPPRLVVIGWDATPAAVRALQGAMPLIRRAERTIVATVTDDKELRPGQSGTALAHLLARHGAAAEVVALKRDGRSVLAALLAAAGGRADAMLAMGAVRHSPLRNMVFGSATQALLDGVPPLPVLLAA